MKSMCTLVALIPMTVQKSNSYTQEYSHVLLHAYLKHFKKYSIPLSSRWKRSALNKQILRNIVRSLISLVLLSFSFFIFFLFFPVKIIHMSWCLGSTYTKYMLFTATVIKSTQVKHLFGFKYNAKDLLVISQTPRSLFLQIITCSTMFANIFNITINIKVKFLFHVLTHHSISFYWLEDKRERRWKKRRRRLKNGILIKHKSKLTMDYHFVWKHFNKLDSSIFPVSRTAKRRNTYLTTTTIKAERSRISVWNIKKKWHKQGSKQQLIKSGM